MLALLTNVRSTKVFLKDSHHPWDGHHQITTFSNMRKFGSQNSLLDLNLAIINSYWKGILLSNIIIGHLTQAEHFRPWS